MTSNNARNGRDLHNEQTQDAMKIDLQGVASFSALIELLAQELGTPAGKIHGNLPSGASFNELIGEIEINTHGFNRKLILFAQPGSPLTLRFRTVWNEGSKGGMRQKTNDDTDDSGIIADYFLAAAVEQILPQGRALARYVEDIFAVLDRMISLGQANRLANMSISPSAIEAFEQAELNNLVRSYVPKNP